MDGFPSLGFDFVGTDCTIAFCRDECGHFGKCTWMLPVKMICTKSQTAFKSTEVKFKLVEEFNATTTAVTLENGTLIQKQAWDGKQRSMERDGKQRLMERDGQQRSMERDGKL
uniref:Lipocalin/cytosolic fatty-acid binding domain-containing protein n=1 Tax=Paramormyrops kingsleyae TaxID=1676925 RepID=A0A3B3QZM9_9TELE